MALKPSVAIGALVVVAVAGALVSASIGAVRYAPATLVHAAFSPSGPDGHLLWSLRFPRIASAIVVGAALALGGTLLQSVLRNPLADPYLTGGSGGAGLAIALAIALGAPQTSYAPLAFVAALGATVLCAALARTGGRVSADRLILAGIALSSLCASLTTLVILFTPRASTSVTILGWLGGSLAGHGWDEIGRAALYAALGATLAVATLPSLNALRTGELRAASLGVDIERTRWLVVAAAALLVAAAVSISGIIGFVGLVVPHVARAVVGSDVRWSALAALPLGAIVMLAADAVARGAAPPLELPVGVLLSILGVPAFLAIAARRVATV